MSLFKEIVNESLLNELRQNRDDDIKKAVNNALRVRMSYDDKKGGKGKRERFILPVAFGLTKSGKKAVRAFETMGSSKRGLTNPPNRRKYPKWKLFLVDNIFSWSNTNRSFKDYKDALIRMGLNTHGDKSMTTLYAITPFADDNVQVSKDTMPIDAKPIMKTDVTPTTVSQSPKNTETDKFEPSAVSRNKEIDNSKENNYLINKVEAPDTQPVTKTDVGGPVNPTNDNAENEKMVANDTAPVTKGEVENPTTDKDAETAKFNDMMNRMDNLYKDNEDENED